MTIKILDTPNTLLSNEPRLKTLYLTGHGTSLAKKQECFIVKKEGEILKQIPAIHVDQILLLGYIQLTTQIMHYCLKKGIAIYFLSSSGHYQGALDNHDTHPIHLHKEQYKKAENNQYCLQLSQQIIKGKLNNSKLYLKRLARSQTQYADQLQQAVQALSRYIAQIETTENLDQLRGIEGIAARTYFQTLTLIVEAKWNFTGRNKMPPTDPINALLSYGYTLLFHNTYSFIKAAGLNPHIGFLHTPRRGHPALASDLMEEFRALIIDAVVFNLVLNNKLSPQDFQQKEGMACFLSDSARKLLIQSIETKFNTAITHPITGNKIDYRRCIEHQTKQLASLMRNDTKSFTSDNPTYQPAIFR